ncbi:MAG TPA: hypothetical protein VFU73_10875 [Actinocrinis sp.]|nr:hypothetical protein [Actinocrinis sp.]
MTVRLITRADDELYSLINTAGKFGRAAKILATLERERAAAPEDVEAVGRLALAQMASLAGMAGDMGAHAIVTDAIESCGQVLALDPDHWLARYARARLRTLAPSGYGSYAQTDPGLAAARQDLQYLIRLQAQLPPQAYFTSTYAAAVLVDRLAGVSDRDTFGGLVDALRDGRFERVGLPALGAVLCEPLAAVYVSGGEESVQEAVGAALDALYGDLPPVVALLRTVAAR